MFAEKISIFYILTNNIPLFSIANAGHLLLAKTRYNQGSQTISVAQVPTEDSEDFNALCQVVEDSNDNTVSGSKKTLVRHKVNKADGYNEPMHWFTALPSMSLRNAAEQFKKSLDFVIESANIQTEMLAIMKSIKHLNALKQQQAI